MIYNKISGSSINISKSFLFSEFEKERFFLTFCKDSETWGNCALVNISLPENTSIVSMLGTNKFIDKNTSGYTEQDSVVFIYKTATAAPDFTSDFNFSKVSELEETSITLQYINSSWAVLKGLPIDYYEYLNPSMGKFYIVSSQTGIYSDSLPTGSMKVKINSKSEFAYTVYSEAVKLDSVMNSSESSAILNLTKTTNVLGEVTIKGLGGASFVSGFTEDILLTNYATYSDAITSETPYFRLKNAIQVNTVIYDKMYLMKTRTISTNTDTIWHYTNDDNQEAESYLLFKTSNQFNEEFYIKVSKGNPESGLEIYHEALPFFYDIINSANNITDANPPGLDLGYLKNYELDSSLYEILGYVKIKKNQTASTDPIYSKISYIKELRTESDRVKYRSKGFVDSTTGAKRLESIPITSDTEIVHFGSVRKNPISSGMYLAGATRIYLYNNTFVLGDTVTVRFWNEAHTELQSVQTVDWRGDILTVAGVSYQENNSYIDLSGPISDILYPDLVEGVSEEFSSVFSAPTNVITKVEYAICEGYDDALKFAMESVMIDMHIPNTLADLYTGVYRQLAICHQPSTLDDSLHLNTCVNDTYTLGLYDNTNHMYHNGTVVFIGNKSPIYRQYISNKEIFKLII